MKLILCLLTLQIVFTTLEGACPKGCDLPTTIYNDLKCLPVYRSLSDCCPSEYDCSHIYNRPASTCHYKGKIYNSGEKINNDDLSGSCKHDCRCQTEGSQPHITCPRLMDGCPEYWVSSYLKPGCYLRHEVNKCCASGQICRPFDNNAKCEVEGKIYIEGKLFDHPTQRCVRCSCEKGFDGKFEKPACQEVLCFAEIQNSENIDKHCAPFYKSLSDCCPDKWVCQSESGKVLPALQESVNKDDLKCKFGKEVIPLGGRYVENDNGQEINCECILPPLLTCGPKKS